MAELWAHPAVLSELRELFAVLEDQSGHLTYPMALERAFAYNDAQRHRIGANFHQLPVNQPKVPVNTYLFDGQMAYHPQRQRADLRRQQRR